MQTARTGSWGSPDKSESCEDLLERFPCQRLPGLPYTEDFLWHALHSFCIELRILLIVCVCVCARLIILQNIFSCVAKPTRSRKELWEWMFCDRRDQWFTHPQVGSCLDPYTRSRVTNVGNPIIFFLPCPTLVLFGKGRQQQKEEDARSILWAWWITTWVNGCRSKPYRPLLIGTAWSGWKEHGYVQLIQLPLQREFLQWAKQLGMSAFASIPPARIEGRKPAIQLPQHHPAAKCRCELCASQCGLKQHIPIHAAVFTFWPNSPFYLRDGRPLRAPEP